MNDIEKLLMYVRKTNPEMTKSQLLEELGKCNYSSNSLVMTWKNSIDKIQTKNQK